MIVDPNTLKNTTLACLPVFVLQLPVVKFLAPPWSDLSVLPLGPLDGLISWQFIRQHMAISIENFKAGRWWTIITHVFAHASVDHFVNNAIATLFSGIGIIGEYNVKAFYGSYTVGAVFGALATFMEYHWNLRDFLKGLRSTFFGAKVANSIGRRGFEYYNRMYMHVGASTSVSGLVGFSAASNWFKLSNRYKRFRALGLSREESVKKLLDVHTYFLLFNLFQLVRSFGGDLLKVTRQKRGISKIKAYSADSIGHSGHVGGFIGGVVFYSLFYNADP